MGSYKHHAIPSHFSWLLLLPLVPFLQFPILQSAKTNEEIIEGSNGGLNGRRSECMRFCFILIVWLNCRFVSFILFQSLNKSEMWAVIQRSGTRQGLFLLNSKHTGHLVFPGIHLLISNDGSPQSKFGSWSVSRFTTEVQTEISQQPLDGSHEIKYRH